MIDRQTKIPIDRETKRQTSRQIYRQTDSEMQTHRQVDLRQTPERPIERQIGNYKQTENYRKVDKTCRQTDRLTERQTDRQ